MRKAKKLLMLMGPSAYGRHVLTGIHAYCSSHGNWDYHIERNTAPPDLWRLRATLGKWRPDGIISHLGLLISSPPMLKLVRLSRLPTVNVSASSQTDLPTVIPDNVAIGRLAAEHFINSGFRRFAFCAITSELFSHRRHEGFVQRLAESGFTCDTFVDRFSGEVELEWVENRRRMQRWLRSLSLPVGVFCIYDLRGYDVIRACQIFGLRVPDDVAVLTVGNDTELCQMCNPPLASIDVNPQVIGYRAAELIEGLIHGRRPPREPLLIPPRTLVMRQSSDVVAVEDEYLASALTYIRGHVSEPLTVKQILRHVPICRKSLEQRFINTVGRTPKEEITRVRLEKAKTLLQETDLPMPAVARGSGFICTGRFSCFFRTRVGMTPTQFRMMGRAMEKRMACPDRNFGTTG